MRISMRLLVLAFGLTAVALWSVQWSLVAKPNRVLENADAEVLVQLRLDLEVEQKVNRELLAEIRALKQQRKSDDAAASSSSAAAATTLPVLPSSPPVPAALRPDHSQFTVVMMSYPKSDRFHRLEAIVKAIRQWKGGMVREVLLVWNGDGSLLPAQIRALADEEGAGVVPFRVLPQSHNRLDNRWRVWREVSTDAILNMDDDMDLKESGVRCLFDVWRSAPDRLVGVDVRSHSDDRDAIARASKRAGIDVDGFAYAPRHVDRYGRKVYSIVLPRAVMGNKKLWRAYDAVEPALRSVVDDLLCDDIAFNFVAANATGAAPVYARASFTPYSESNSKNSLQKLKNMKARRQRCLPALAALFSDGGGGGSPGHVPLQYNSWYATCSWDGESGNHK